MFLGFIFRLFSKLFSFVSGSMDPETISKRLLKQTAREISRNKFSRFYKPRAGEVTGAMGKFFYDIYRIFAPVQVVMQNAAKSAVLKHIVVEFFLTDRLDYLKMRLTDEAIAATARTMDIKEMEKAFADDIAALSAGFDQNRIRNIDGCYNNILAMCRFITYDFVGLLKKFDPRIIEGDFYYEPLLTNIPGTYIAAELREFLEISIAVDPNEDWSNILQILRISRNGIDVIDRDQWARIMGLFRSIRRSGILELMVRHIEKAPNWQAKPRTTNAQIAEQYLEEKQASVKAALEKIGSGRKKAFHDTLVNTIFGGTEVNRAQYYTEAAGEIYIENGFDGFLYATAVNYLLTFLENIFKPELYPLCDHIFVKGKWIAPEFSRETSENMHLLTELTERLTAFDESFSEDGYNGARLKKSIERIDYDRPQRRLVTSILGVANEEVLQMIRSAAWLCMSLNNNLSILLEDRRSNTHTFIINWQELESSFSASLTQCLASACEKLNSLSQLMLLLVGPEDEAETEEDETGALDDIETFEAEESGNDE